MTTTPSNGALVIAAESYLSAGLCALPAIRRGDEKRVAMSSWKQYQLNLPSPQEPRTWFDDGRGGANSVCIVCGAVSGNLEMIDFDLAGEAFEPWKKLVEATSPGLFDRLVVETSPSGGFHVVYRCDCVVSGNMKLAQRRIECDDAEPLVVAAKSYMPRQDAMGKWHILVTMIETRGEGGLFLCDPSDGYKVIQGDLRQPPVITADERIALLDGAWKLNEVQQPTVARPQAASAPPVYHGDPLKPGDDYNHRGDVRELLLNHGWTLVRSGDNELWRRPGKTTGSSATLKIVDGLPIFYVFSSNAAPFEPEKGYSPFAVYTLLERCGDYTSSASALAAEGYGVDPAADADDGFDLGQFLTPEPAVGTENEPSPIPVGELVDAYPLLRPPVIYGLLREGETMNIIAAPKTGKSWLALDLAISVATGQKWLGQYNTEQGDVLIMDNELHRPTSAHRVPQVADARGVAMSEIATRIYIDNLRGRLRSIDRMGAYFERLEPGRFKVIVLDAFYRFMPTGGDENDNGAMRDVFNTLDRIAQRLGCCFVLIHHSSKGNQAGKGVTDVGAGAGAQSRAADTHLVLRPHQEKDVIVLDAAVRSWKPVEPVCLRWSFPVWDVDATLDPEDLQNERSKKKKKAEAVEETKPKAETWTVERFVETFITEEPILLKKLHQNVVEQPGLSWRNASLLLDKAERDGHVNRIKTSGRGAPAAFVLPAKNKGLSP